MNWDLNLAFGTANVGGGAAAPGAPGGAGGGGVPVAPPGGGVPAGGGGAGGPGVGGPGAEGPGAIGGNVLVERFLEVEEFAAMYADATAELTSTLYASGAAEDIVDTWVEVLSAQASDLVDSTTSRPRPTRSWRRSKQPDARSVAAGPRRRRRGEHQVSRRVRPAAGRTRHGLGGGRTSRAGCGDRASTRSHRARRDDARTGRLRDAPTTPRRRQPDAGHLPHRPGRDRRSGARA